MVSHKRLQLKTPADQLYPEDYDFSIVFDSVENRKARHQMGKNAMSPVWKDWKSFEEGDDLPE